MLPQLSTLYTTPHPDAPTIVAAYHALVQAFPKVGHPLYQREYDEFFHFFKSIYDATPEESEEHQLLSAVKSDYIKQLTDNLSERDDETFRSESYFWLTVKAGMGHSSPYFTDVLPEDAEKRIFINYDRLKTTHNGAGCYLPDLEITWLLNMLIAMQLNPGHRYSMEEECISMAKENLHALKNTADSDGSKTQLLALLHLHTGTEQYRQLADAIIATWYKDHLSLEQQYFLQYYQMVTHHNPARITQSS